MSDAEPTKVLVGVFPNGMPAHVFIPCDGLKPAERILDAERQKRERLASQAKTEALRGARNQTKLKRALTALGFRRGRRGR
jgi:hypothetical protein